MSARISALTAAGALTGNERVPLLQVGASVAAGSFVVGTAYFILTVGTTDFTAIGAASNTGGLLFTATGAGSGTGTAGPALNRLGTAQEIADLGGGGGGSGLYSPVLSTVPTSANTGLGTWTNQGSSTVADRATGITLYPNTTNLAIRRKAVPATPYKVRALVALNSAPTGTPAAGIGWYDGTNKLHVIYVIYNAGWKFAVDRWTSPTVFSADETGFPKAAIANPMWLGLEDDGTTVKFQSSYSGNDEDYITEFSVAKASGFLGSSGYAHIAFVAAGTAGAVSGSLMSYDEE